MRVLAVIAALLVVFAAPASAAGGFETYRPGATEVTYDPAVPVGSHARAIRFPAGRGTAVALLVHGLLPDRHYGAHVHVNPCGPLPADSGPHFQHDPAAGANPTNEVWLDFTTDARGSAFTLTVVPWRFGGRPAGSVVIHDHHTAPDGTAGPRLACLTKGF
ncbi:superoxide dismutase [Actinokineospora sp. HUAS TT18]|uniref:superoxide dismutase n=1 Tax=Actinokineospora sp. HUAS TT18 TaxID=3447451 RepID=UPI003F51CB5D